MFFLLITAISNKNMNNINDITPPNNINIASKYCCKSSTPLFMIGIDNITQIIDIDNMNIIKQMNTILRFINMTSIYLNNLNNNT